MGQNKPETVMYLSAVKVRSKICTAAKHRAKLRNGAGARSGRSEIGAGKNTNISVAKSVRPRRLSELQAGRSADRGRDSGK